MFTGTPNNSKKRCYQYIPDSNDTFLGSEKADDTNDGELQDGQRWDDDPRPIGSSTMLSIFVNTSQEQKGRKTTMQSGTQTPSPLEKNETNIKLANESWATWW